MRILTVLVVLVLSVPLVAQTPALTSAQVQQATLIKARDSELGREYAAAVKALEEAAATLATVKQQQADLSKRAQAAAAAYVAALGGDPKTDAFDWATLALRAKAAPAK